MRELDDLIAEIVVDCHDEDECMMAFCTALGDEIPVPFETVHGRELAAQVEDLDWDEYSLWGCIPRGSASGI
ncbi:MAG: hypothetical protein ACRDST_04330 [Pseudonocardiaceae bacterium]